MTGELVVLVDDRDVMVATASKDLVHTDQTPLHRAFSCYVFNEDGELLLTRRALTKKTWPGVWTNSVCGHPGPGESQSGAIARRMREELGAEVCDIEVALPTFRYRATDASGVVENEICPVHTARLASPLHPNPSEVAEYGWVRPEHLAAALAATPMVFSPWLQLQVPALLAGGLLAGPRS